jgi:hypothetical protein
MWACVVNEYLLNMLSKGVLLNWQYTLINGLQGFIMLIKSLDSSRMFLK